LVGGVYDLTVYRAYVQRDDSCISIKRNILGPGGDIVDVFSGGSGVDSILKKYTSI
jgi:hypothetical protein